MSEISKISANVTHNDINKLKPSNAQNTSATTGLNGNKASELSNSDSNAFSPNINKSNFDSFIQILRNVPTLSDIMTDGFLFRLDSLFTSDIDSSFNTEVKKLMQLMNMSKEELVVFLKSQFVSSTKFSGAFFDRIRTLYNTTTSSEIKSVIIELMKRFDCMTSSNHINENILSNLNTIQSYMMKSHAQKLSALVSELNIAVSNGETQNNLMVLKDSIMPFLGSFIKQTNNFGEVRDFITLLSVNIALLEYSSKEEFTGTLDYLLSFNEVKAALEKFDLSALKQELINFNFPKKELELTNSFVSIISEGLSGKASFFNRSVFQDMMSSLLLNESVYMSLMHLVVPVKLNNKTIFSEIWVDSDDKKSENPNDSDYLKLFLKFDIQDVGFFETIIIYRNNEIDMRLFVPSSLRVMNKKIQSDISSIIQNNGMGVKTLSVTEIVKPKSLIEVFPKLLERKAVINVTV